jgi:divalent metal cation (Fe/Co/Zn/Cd) transporter
MHGNATLVSYAALLILLDCTGTHRAPHILIRGERRSLSSLMANVIDTAVAADAASRPALVRRGIWLNVVTMSYNLVEALVSLLAGLIAGSVALVGFGADSLIEVSAAVAAQWRLQSEANVAHRARAEHTTIRIVGWCFLALAVYVAADSVKTLWLREAPDTSIVGIVLTSVSVVVMPLLARAKRRVAHGLSSRALRAEAAQTSLCAYLSAITLAGLILNATLGWWWADPLAALGMVPIITREALAALRGAHCDDCC